MQIASFIRQTKFIGVSALMLTSAVATASLCSDQAETSRLACTTTDTSAGMEGGEASQVQQLLQQIQDENNQVSQLSSRGSSTPVAGQAAATGSTAAMAKLEQQRSDNLAKLSSLKANACQRARTACHASCSGGQIVHQIWSEAAMDPEQQSSENNLASSRTGQQDTCDGYEKNVQAAMSQMSAEIQNSATNTSVQNGTEGGTNSTALGAKVGGVRTPTNVGTVTAVPVRGAVSAASATSAAEPLPEAAQADTGATEDPTPQVAGQVSPRGTAPAIIRGPIRDVTITPAGGLSNFEKIHSRYESLKGILIED